MLEKTEKTLEWGGMKKDIICLAVSGFVSAASILGIQPFLFQMAWIAIILCGLFAILEAITGPIKEFDIEAGVLVSIALIVSVIIGEDFAAGEMALTMQLRALLEDMTMARIREGIEKLVHLMPRATRGIVGSGGQKSAEAQGMPGEQIIPAGQVRAGDLPRALPRETIPVSGVILSRQTSINQAVMTGGSLPADKRAGGEMSSGTVNQFGPSNMRAAEIGKDNSL